MRDRCYNPRDKRYDRYGARGIEVCDQWRHSFLTFYSDMGNKPSLDHQLDRINNDVNYEPENCKWATRIEQCNNRRSNTYYTYNGQTMTLSQWARHVGINHDKLRQRVRRYGWSIEDALTK